MSDFLREHVEGQVIRWLVSKTMFCPVTGVVLDVRTCHLLRDADGDPAAVIGPGAWAQLSDGQKDALAASGYTYDDRSAR